MVKIKIITLLLFNLLIITWLMSSQVNAVCIGDVMCAGMIMHCDGGDPPICTGPYYEVTDGFCPSGASCGTAHCPAGYHVVASTCGDPAGPPPIPPTLPPGVPTSPPGSTPTPVGCTPNDHFLTCGTEAGYNCDGNICTEGQACHYGRDNSCNINYHCVTDARCRSGYVVGEISNRTSGVNLAPTGYLPNASCPGTGGAENSLMVISDVPGSYSNNDFQCKTTTRFQYENRTYPPVFSKGGLYYSRVANVYITPPPLADTSTMQWRVNNRNVVNNPGGNTWIGEANHETGLGIASATSGSINFGGCDGDYNEERQPWYMDIHLDQGQYRISYEGQDQSYSCTENTSSCNNNNPSASCGTRCWVCSWHTGTGNSCSKQCPPNNRDNQAGLQLLDVNGNQVWAQNTASNVGWQNYSGTVNINTDMAYHRLKLIGWMNHEFSFRNLNIERLDGSGNSYPVNVWTNGMSVPGVPIFPGNTTANATRVDFQYNNVAPRACGITAPAVMSSNTPVTVSLNGNSFTTASQAIRLWVENRSGGTIVDAGTSISPSVVGYSGGTNGIKYYYDLSGSLGCNSSNSTTCSRTGSLSLPAGDYYLHCDVNTALAKCTGNPFIVANGNGAYCSAGAGTPICESNNGWVGCAGTDTVAVHVNATPSFTNSPPDANIRIYNLNNQLVPMENTGTGVSGNQICQTTFSNGIISPRSMFLDVIGTDIDGGTDINSIGVSTPTWAAMLTGMTTPSPVSTVVGAILPAPVTFTTNLNTATVRFTLNFPSNFNPSTLENIRVNITDKLGASTGWVNSDRYFKVWNCEIPVSGTIYDGSSVTQDCYNGDGFTQAAGTDMGFGALDYRNLGSGSDAATNEILPATYDTTILTWGSVYRPEFAPALNGSSPMMRLVDTGNGNTLSCDLLASVDTGASRANSIYNISPYVANVGAVIDYSSVMNQASWYQVEGAGVASGITVLDSVPPTCRVAYDLDPTNPICVPATSRASQTTTANNGIISSPNLSSNSGCGTNCWNAHPQDWSINSSILGQKLTYSKLYRDLLEKLGVGITLSPRSAQGVTMTEVLAAGGTGVVFVNGNMDVDIDNVVASDGFLMVVASGTITVRNTVNQMSGIFVSDVGINIGGLSANQLVVNGSLYSNGDSSQITITRNLSNPGDNNTIPAVVVRYRPDMLISSPVGLTKVLTGFKEGN